MESISTFINNKSNEYNTVNTTEVNKLTPLSTTQKTNGVNTNETSLFDINDNININNEIEITKEKRKINIFNIAEEQSKEEEEDNNLNEIRENGILISTNDKYKDEKEENDNNKDNNKNKKNTISFQEDSMENKTKKLRIIPNKSFYTTKRRSVFPKGVENSIFGTKNKNFNNKRKTLVYNDFNKMKRISITNFNKLNNNINKVNKKKNNSRNMIKYENMFLDDELYMRAPGSFPDEEDQNYLLNIKFLEDCNYIEEDRLSNNGIKNNQRLRQTNSISFNSNMELNIQSKFLLRKSSIYINKIIEEENEEKQKMRKRDRITMVNNAIKNIYIDENDMPGKNILYNQNLKLTNKFQEGTFNRSLVSKEDESPISYISINLLIKRIALYNFRIIYPLLYKAFLQQYKIFLSVPLFIEKIMQAFELYYNNHNKVANELVSLLNKVISDNYEKIKEDLILIEKLKNFYSFLKDYFFTGSDSALDQEVNSIYYILFDPDSEEDIIFSRRFVLERRKSNSIFIKSKVIYSNIFNKMINDKTTKKRRRLFTRNRTVTNLNYKYFYIFNHDAMEIAEYLTCISYQMMRNINQNELLNKNFSNKDKYVKAPNVMKLIERFNNLVLFIIEDVFSYDNKKTRAHCLEKWLDVALKLKDIRNYNDLVMINTCFVNCTLNKLKLTFKKLSSKYKTILKEMNSFCSSQECYINIRKTIFNCKGIPYIPYQGILLKEIVNIEEEKYIIGENNINFSKLVKLYNTLDRFNEFKKSKFSFEKSKQLDILMELKPKTETELEEMIPQIEPKLKIFASKGNKKRLTNTDKYYYEKKANTQEKNK